MRIAMYLACVTCLTLLAGCSEPRFDGSNKAAMLASIERMTAGMTPEEKQEFHLAFGVAIMEDATTLTPFASVNGLTAKEIVAIGNKKIAEIHARNVETD